MNWKGDDALPAFEEGSKGIFSPLPYSSVTKENKL